MLTKLLTQLLTQILTFILMGGGVYILSVGVATIIEGFSKNIDFLVWRGSFIIASLLLALNFIVNVFEPKKGKG